MDNALLQRLGRMEAMIAALLQMQRPTMTFREVKESLGLKSNSSVYLWLKGNGIYSSNRRYDRTRVIAAQTK